MRRASKRKTKRVFQTRWNYAMALYQDEGATLDDLREAVTTLEDAGRIARRVSVARTRSQKESRENYETRELRSVPARRRRRGARKNATVRSQYWGQTTPSTRA